MNKSESEMGRFDKIVVSIQPDVAINICWGLLGYLGDDHHRYVVKKKRIDGGEIWERENLAEFNSLDDALGYPGAVPYGSGSCCNSCKGLVGVIEDIIARKNNA